MKSEIFGRAFVSALMLMGALAGHAFAQNPGSGQLSTTPTAQFGPPFATINGHFGLGAGAPPSTNAACGTDRSAVEGTDSAFTFVSGTSSSSACTVTPAILWSRRPICNVTLEGSAAAPAYSVTGNGTLLLTGVADSTRYNVICIAQPGGF